MHKKEIFKLVRVKLEKGPWITKKKLAYEVSIWVKKLKIHFLQ